MNDGDTEEMATISEVGSCGISGEEVNNQWDLLDQSMQGRLPSIQLLRCSMVAPFNSMMWEFDCIAGVL